MTRQKKWKLKQRLYAKLWNSHNSTMSTQWRTNTLDANRQIVYRPLQDLNIWNHVFLKGYLGHNSCLDIFYGNCQRIFEGLWAEIISLKYNIYILGRRGIKIICLLFQIERPVFNFEGLSPTSYDITLIGQPCLQNSLVRPSTGQAGTMGCSSIPWFSKCICWTELNGWRGRGGGLRGYWNTQP